MCLDLWSHFKKKVKTVKGPPLKTVKIKEKTLGSQTISTNLSSRRKPPDVSAKSLCLCRALFASQAKNTPKAILVIFFPLNLMTINHHLCGGYFLWARSKEPKILYIAFSGRVFPNVSNATIAPRNPLYSAPCCMIEMLRTHQDKRDFKGMEREIGNPTFPHTNKNPPIFHFS